MKNEPFKKPTSHRVPALAFFSNASKKAVESCLKFLCLGQNTAGFKMLMPACTFCTKTLTSAQRMKSPAPQEVRWARASLVLSGYPLSYLPLPACLVLDLCCCSHDGVLLSGNFRYGAQREKKGSIRLEEFIFERGLLYGSGW